MVDVFRLSRNIFHFIHCLVHVFIRLLNSQTAQNVAMTKLLFVLGRIQLLKFHRMSHSLYTLCWFVLCSLKYNLATVFVILLQPEQREFVFFILPMCVKYHDNHYILRIDYTRRNKH